MQHPKDSPFPTGSWMRGEGKLCWKPSSSYCPIQDPPLLMGVQSWVLQPAFAWPSAPVQSGL